MILHNTIQTGCVLRLSVNNTEFLGWTDLLLHRDLLDSHLGPRGVQSTLPARAEVSSVCVCVCSTLPARGEVRSISVCDRGREREKEKKWIKNKKRVSVIMLKLFRCNFFSLDRRRKSCHLKTSVGTKLRAPSRCLFVNNTVRNICECWAAHTLWSVLFLLIIFCIWLIFFRFMNNYRDLEGKFRTWKFKKKLKYTNFNRSILPFQLCVRAKVLQQGERDRGRRHVHGYRRGSRLHSALSHARREPATISRKFAQWKSATIGQWQSAKFDGWKCGSECGGWPAWIACVGPRGEEEHVPPRRDYSPQSRLQGK